MRNEAFFKASNTRIVDNDIKSTVFDDYVLSQLLPSSFIAHIQ